MFSMLLDATANTPGTTDTIYIPTWVETLSTAVTKVLNPILIVACLVGIIYAIWVGITFAKAEDSNARKEAKQKLITVIVGVVAAIALVILFYWIADMLRKGDINFDFLKDADKETNKEENKPDGSGVITIMKTGYYVLKSFI